MSKLWHNTRAKRVSIRLPLPGVTVSSPSLWTRTKHKVFQPLKSRSPPPLSDIKSVFLRFAPETRTLQVTPVLGRNMRFVLLLLSSSCLERGQMWGLHSDEQKQSSLWPTLHFLSLDTCIRSVDSCSFSSVLSSTAALSSDKYTHAVVSSRVLFCGEAAAAFSHCPRPDFTVSFSSKFALRVASPSRDSASYCTCTLPDLVTSLSFLFFVSFNPSGSFYNTEAASLTAPFVVLFCWK